MVTQIAAIQATELSDEEKLAKVTAAEPATHAPTAA